MFTRAGFAAFTLVACVSVPANAQSRSLGADRLSLTLGDVHDGELSAAIDRAARGARRRLAREACASLLEDFRDSSGRALTDVVSGLGLAPQDLPSRAIFRDGREAATCRDAPVAAFTGAGSRVVFICGNRFLRFSRDEAERIIVHEMLHTVGLGERPPTPAQIDRAVDRRCR